MLDHERLIQWFNAVQDLNPSYLTREDGELAIKLLRQLGRRIPDSVAKLAYPDGVPTVVHTGWQVHGNGSITRTYAVEIAPVAKPPCAFCGTPFEQHGSYPTCATHPYTDGVPAARKTVDGGM